MYLDPILHKCSNIFDEWKSTSEDQGVSGVEKKFLFPRLRAIPGSGSVDCNTCKKEQLPEGSHKWKGITKNYMLHDSILMNSSK